MSGPITLEGVAAPMRKEIDELFECLKDDFIANGGLTEGDKMDQGFFDRMLSSEPGKIIVRRKEFEARSPELDVAKDYCDRRC